MFGLNKIIPIDSDYKFLNYRKLSLAVFIDSESWPNMLLNINKKNIPTILLNARITEKSFKR